MRTGASELGALLRLAAPIVAVQFGLHAMMAVDVALMGRVSPGALAGVAIGHTFAIGVIIFTMHALTVLDPIVSQAFGRRDERAVALGVQRGIVLALALSVPAALFLLPVETILGWLDQPAEILPDARAYVLALIPGVPALHLFIVFRQSLQALHKTRAILVVILGGNVANWLLDLALIHGSFGFPALGAQGCGYATSLCRWLMTLALLGLAWPELRAHLRPIRREAFAPRALLSVLGLAIPVGLQAFVEVTAFGLTAVFMGWFGEVPLAGHEVTLTLAALSFMIPLGVSSAAAVRVGHGIGRGDQAGARRAAIAALCCGGAVMLVPAAAFGFASGPLGRLFTQDAPTLAVVTTILPIAAVFQIFDGLQVVATGALRGSGDVRAPMWIHLAGFYLCGLPCGLALARPFGADLGPAGLWIGLVAGLAVVAVALVWRTRRRFAREIGALAFDEEATRGRRAGALADLADEVLEVEP